jgi:N-acetylmuramoyl-L-alanine amidase
MTLNIHKIYLHWSATSYTFPPPGSSESPYHTVVQGDGTIRRIAGYDQTKGHTFQRNSNAAGIACACMGGVTWVDFPPTAIQIENMCREAAALARSLGWKPEEIGDLPNVNRILTHAEAAANRDFPETLARLGTGVSPKRAIELGLPHDNYGPSGWPDKWPSGTFERSDFFKIQKSDPDGSGGDILRQMIRKYMDTSEPSPLDNTASNKIFLNGDEIASGFILSDNRCYVKLIDLINPLGIELGNVQSGTERFINLLSDRFSPKFIADSPLVLGFPSIDIYLNRPIDTFGNPVGDFNKPIKPFIGGVLINASTYVLIADFCDELGIKSKFDSSSKSIQIMIS